MRYRIRFNKENNLWYFEKKSWFRWKCVQHDTNYDLLEMKAHIYLFVIAKVAIFKKDK